MDEALIAAIKERHIRIGDAGIGHAARQRAPLQIADVRTEPASEVLDVVVRAGYRAVLIVPLLGAERIVGALVVRRKRPGEFSKQTIDLLQTFAAQSVLAIQNARLFHEIEDKSRQLEVASQHKSQFLANMSHELRTPLNAILGYTELILDGIYGETPAKMRGVLERVQRNGKHLLGLINDVLDLSKIEAGQLTLALSDYSLKDVVQTVFSAIEPLASEKKLAFKIDVAQRAAARARRRAPPHPGPAQPRRQRDQIHRCRARSRSKAPRPTASFMLSVRDTGPGISAADQAKLFQEFQQADNSITKKKGGTGLGLPSRSGSSRCMADEFGWSSSPGNGSTFAFTLPVRVEEQARPA